MNEASLECDIEGYVIHSIAPPLEVHSRQLFWCFLNKTKLMTDFMALSRHWMYTTGFSQYSSTLVEGVHQRVVDSLTLSADHQGGNLKLLLVLYCCIVKVCIVKIFDTEISILRMIFVRRYVAALLFVCFFLGARLSVNARPTGTHT